MERSFRLAGLWNWLPAFRIVAETESLRTAAVALHVSPSALSRSVKQLEDALGQPLFVREQARLRLNHAGAAFLVAVRDAMRRLDDAVTQIGSGALERIRIAGRAAWLERIAFPAFATLERHGTAPCVDVLEVPATEIASALLRGELDLAICETVDRDANLAIAHLGAVERVICQRRTRATLPYALCTDEDDPWPSSVERRVALRTPHLASVIQACVEGRVRAMLPRVIARELALQVLPALAIADAQLYLVRRRPLGDNPLDAVAAAICERATAVLRPRAG